MWAKMRFLAVGRRSRLPKGTKVAGAKGMLKAVEKQGLFDFGIVAA
jgi:hypothetical protein